MEELAVPRAGRLCFIDGLRGIASAIVAVFHFYVFGHLTGQLSRVFPHVLTAMLIHGNVGVSVFFCHQWIRD